MMFVFVLLLYVGDVCFVAVALVDVSCVLLCCVCCLLLLHVCVVGVACSCFV